MTSKSNNEVKSKRSKVKREESLTGTYAMIRPFAFLLFTFYLLSLVCPAHGQGQYSSRRDRSRRDSRQEMTQPGPVRAEARPAPGRTESSAKTASASAAKTPAGPSGRLTKPADANTAPAPVVHRSRRDVKDPQWAQYEVLFERNMFSRFRRSPRQRDDGPQPPRIVPNPESYFLLRGVTQQDHQFIAFVEDKNTGVVLRLHQGDSVARGQVKSLTLDSLEYQFQDKTTTVSVGYDLEGGRGAVTGGDLASFTPSAPTATPTGATAAPAADEAEVLKRLMEQRKQQLGQ